jgi:hypothetical protein
MRFKYGKICIVYAHTCNIHTYVHAMRTFVARTSVSILHFSSEIVALLTSCVYVCEHMHACSCMCLCVFVCLYMYFVGTVMYVHMCVYVYIVALLTSGMQICINVCMHVCVCVDIHIYTCMIYIHTHTYIHTHIHICLHTRIHAKIYMVTLLTSYVSVRACLCSRVSSMSTCTNTYKHKCTHAHSIP